MSGSGVQRRTSPPSTHKTCPVSAAAPSEARNATAAAVSAGVSRRLRACRAIVASKVSSVLTVREAGVSVRPGATAVTATPTGPSARQGAHDSDEGALARDVRKQYRSRRFPKRVGGDEHDATESVLRHSGREGLG